MNKTFLAFLTTTLISSASLAEIDPNDAILNALGGASEGTDFREVARKVAQLSPKAGEENLSAQPTPKAVQKAISKKTAKKKPSGRRATTWFSSKGDGTRVSFSFTNRPKYKRYIKGNKISLNFSAPVGYTAPAIPVKFAEAFKSVKEVSKNGKNLALEVEVNDGYDFKVTHNSRRVFVDLVKKKVVAKVAPVRKLEDIKAPNYEVEVEKKEDEVAAKKVNASEIKFSINSKGIETLIFDFAGKSKAAAFQKFGNFWVVFDSESNAKVPEGVDKSNIFNGFEIVNNKPLTIKLPLKKRAYAVADKIGSRWELQFDTALNYELEKPLQVFENKDYISISSSSAGEVVKVKDDVFGEEFSVIPLENSGEALSQQIAKREVVFEPTVQGIVFREINEYADLSRSDSGIKFFKLAEAIKNIAAGEKKPAFEFQKWRQLPAKDFAERSRDLERTGQYEYAEFLLTQRLYTEATVILKGLNGAKAGFLTGVGHFMEGKYDLALEAFNRVNLPFDADQEELLMWQIATNQKLRETAPQLVQEIDFIDGFDISSNLSNYPDDIAAEIILTLAEARIDRKEPQIAEAYLSRMPKKALARQYLYQEYLAALVDNMQGKKARARETWEHLAKDTLDNKVRGRAYYNIVMQDYEQHRIDRSQLIEGLANFRVIWRGDNFEYKMLTELAAYREAEGQISQALRDYREAVKAFPSHPKNLKISKDMRQIYTQAILKDTQSPEETYNSLATYYEFEELKPQGEKGDQIALELAEKLVSLDLLSEAADVLQRQAKKVKDSEGKALLLTRVAILNYLDNNTQAALKVLADSEINNMPRYLQSERNILRAEVFINTGEYAQAKALLPKIANTGRVQQLKTEILWREQDWKALAAAYDSQINYTDDDLIRLTIAYAILGDNSGLQDIRSEYQDRMAKSKYAKSFAFVTEGNAVDYRDLNSSLGLGKAKDTISSYRERLDFGAIKENKSDNGGSV